MSRRRSATEVYPAEAKGFLAKAKEFLEQAARCLEAGAFAATTSLAVHAGISAGDAVTAVRLGARANGQEHSQSLALMRDAGKDGKAIARPVGRLLPLKTRAEYEARGLPRGQAERAVTWAEQALVVARRVVAELTG